jgi:hypothetical protein
MYESNGQGGQGGGDYNDLRKSKKAMNPMMMNSTPYMS